MPRRFIIRIELTQSAKGKLAEISDYNGMTQVSVASRLMEWFAAQPELIQAAVLGRYPKEIQVDIAKLILQRMANANVEPEKS
jgi:hypothetical protein